MKLIIEQLKECIRSHPDVLNSSIGSTQKWKRTQCIILSQIISDNLSKSEFLKKGAKKNKVGTTISGMTLQRIFNDSYTEKENPDLRFLKTLDKLAIFLGHASLNKFLAHQSLHEEKKPEKEPEILNCLFENLIFHYCQTEFECLQKLPLVEDSKLSEYLFEDGPLINRIGNFLRNLSQLDFRISDDDKQSNFEVFDFKIVSIDDDLVVLTAKEFWNLEWKDINGNITETYNKINRQTYFIKKRNEIWKIWDNHNPDHNGLITEVEQMHAKQVCSSELVS